MQIGQAVLYQGKKYRIVGVDDSPPHPSAGMVDFRYIIRNEEGKTIKIQNESDLSCIE